MKIKPLADRVLFQPLPPRERPLKGKVLATGDGTKDEKMVVKEGDTVLYGKYAGTEVDLGDDKALIMRQNEVLAVIVK